MAPKSMLQGTERNSCCDTVRLCFAQAFTKEHTKVDMMLQVREPSTSTEFEVQAYLWSELKKLGVNVRGEVKAKFDISLTTINGCVSEPPGVLKKFMDPKMIQIKSRNSGRRVFNQWRATCLKNKS